MPPKRRSRSSRTANPSQQQSTLSFHGKPNNITKPTRNNQQITNKAKLEPVLDQISTPEITTSDPIPAEQQPIEDQTTQKSSFALDKPCDVDPLETVSEATKTEDILGGRAAPSDSGAVGGIGGAGWVGDEEERARKIPETQIKRYWRAKEQERLAPRVHQEELSVHEKVLREWDMSNQYGPCIGIARLKRWKRANLLGLDPPIEVLAVLLRGMEDSSNATRSQQAYVDELLTSRNTEIN